MISDWELWACADTVLRQHGPRAHDHIAERCTALAEAGDDDGHRTWLAILERLKKLEHTAAPPGYLQ